MGAVMRKLIAAGVLVSAALLAPNAHADITEDSPSWSCVDDGNHICGPNNNEGKPAGCYDDGGVLIARWPCHDQYIGDGQWDVVADPGSPDYDEGKTYDDPDEAVYEAGYRN